MTVGRLELDFWPNARWELGFEATEAWGWWLNLGPLSVAWRLASEQTDG
jgi:hypothetical protein